MHARLTPRRSPARSAPVLALLLLAGCASGSAPSISVSRFWTTPPPAGQTVAVEPAVPDSATSLVQQGQASAIAAAFAAAGFPAAPPASADLVASFRASEQVGPAAPSSSPVSIGIGGGVGGGGGGGGFGGVGGSVAFPVGGSKMQVMLQSQLVLTLKRRGGSEPLWEGRASATQVGQSPATDWGLLARAALSDYPGAAGKTVSWKPRP